MSLTSVTKIGTVLSQGFNRLYVSLDGSLLFGGAFYALQVYTVKQGSQK